MTAAEVERLYREHGHVVLRRARQILGDDDEARDVLQELFTRLVWRGASYERRCAATTWLYVLTTNACLTRLRDRRTRARLLAAHAPRESRVGPDGEVRVALAEILAGVPAELAEVAVYYHGDGMTQEEIAELLGCSRRRVSDLVARLAAHVDKQGRAA